jgi:glutathione S-transferase
MPGVEARLYVLGLSHPSWTARLMLERKGIDARVTTLVSGMHPPVLRAAGFRENTVPALKLDGRRIQGSIDIARALEDAVPDPPLYPADPAQRRAVEQAEQWGESILQPVPRRLIRQALTHSPALRRFIAADSRMPFPGAVGPTLIPLAKIFARSVGASDERAWVDISELPERLDHVDELIAAGTIGGPEPNAADFQIGTTVRMLSAFPELRSLVMDRPAGGLARRILPEYPDFPESFPADWLRARPG